jgi:AcrR family transcriptional regulator
VAVKQAQDGTPPALTPRQHAMLEAALNVGFLRSLTDICNEAGVPRRTFYNWLKDDTFRAAWEGLWRQSVQRNLPGVMAAMVHRAMQGDVAAGRLLSELAGILKQQGEVSGGMTVRVVYEDRNHPTDEVAPRAGGHPEGGAAL